MKIARTRIDSCFRNSRRDRCLWQAATVARIVAAPAAPIQCGCGADGGARSGAGGGRSSAAQAQGSAAPASSAHRRSERISRATCRRAPGSHAVGVLLISHGFQRHGIRIAWA
jgi:hypothetical protein